MFDRVLSTPLTLFYLIMVIMTETVAQRCSLKKVFLEISQNLQENTCARVSFLIKLQAVMIILYLYFKTLKGCIGYIFANLFCIPKREPLRKE